MAVLEESWRHHIEEYEDLPKNFQKVFGDINAWLAWILK
jgi:hypothetical protein